MTEEVRNHEGLEENQVQPTDKAPKTMKRKVAEGMVVGIGLGAMFGIALNSLPIGLALGVALGAGMETDDEEGNRIKNRRIFRKIRGKAQEIWQEMDEK